MEDTTRSKELLNRREDMKILNWLSAEHYGAQQSDTLKRWHPETGQWFLGSQEYQDWLQTKNRTLYCPGIPGAGKTIMASAAIHDIRNRFSMDPTVGIAYIYFSFSRQREQTLEHVIGSLLMQLLRGHSPLPQDILDLYELHSKGGTRPTLSEISKILQSIVSGYERTFIILDALDECTVERQCRAKVLTEVISLQTNFEVNILAMSRMHDEIATKFDTHNASVVPIVALEKDMEVVLRNQMRLHDPEIFDESFCTVVTSEIIKMTEGM